MKIHRATSEEAICVFDLGFTKQVTLCAMGLIWAGAANATLVGDSVTVGHYVSDSTGTIALPGATPPSSFAVQAGNADIYTFYNSHPFGYIVNVEANSIVVDFNYLNEVTGTWADSQTTTTFTGVPPCTFYGCASYDQTITTVPYTFNGLGVLGLNDSSGNALQGVLVETNMAGWNSSMLSFGSDSVQFDWKGLSFNSEYKDASGTVVPATYFNATLNFGGIAAPVPEPETYAMLLAGLGLLGFMGRYRKLKEAA